MRNCYFGIVLIFLISACHSPNEHKNNKEKILHINFGTDPPSLDPRKLIDNVSAYLANMCFDGLTRINKEGLVELSLADSYTLSEDRCCYTFKIRAAIWSNGESLTAYDFEKSWKSSLDPSFPCPSAFAFYSIKNAQLAKEGLISLDEVGIQALNEETLQVELLYPYPHFLELLSLPYYYPYTDAIASNNNAFLEKQPVSFISLGPFYIESYKLQDKISLKKNPHYWDKNSVHLDGVDVFFVSDQNSELSMYEQGEIDWAGGPCSNLPTEAMSSLKPRADFHHYQIPALYYYVLNSQIVPFNNVNIRKALTLCINRQELIDHVIQTNMEPATRLIPTMLSPLPIPSFQDGDILKAKELFKTGCKELGLTSFPTITLSYNAGQTLHYKVAQAIQQQWKEVLGINTHLETLEWKVYIDAILHQNFQVARLGATALCHDPAFFLEMFAYKQGFANHTGWHNQEFEQLFINSQHAPTGQRSLIIQQAEKLFLEEMPIIPLFFYTNSYLKKDYISDVVLDNNGFDFKWANINR